MKIVGSIGEAIDAVNLARRGAKSYCSNFFFAPQKLQGWIAHREVLCEGANGAVLFLRQDRDFWHLYFCATDPVALRCAVAALPMLRTEPVITDVVGQEAALVELLGLLENAGFRRYNRLLRMARTAPPATTTAAALDPRMVTAGKEDCQPILDLLLRSFDCRAEQIPMLYEVEAAVEAGQIWLARCGSALGGLLFHEAQGLTSTLRYWLVAAEYRDQGLGSALMNRYLAECPRVRRFLLWVLADNARTIQKYEHYGFAPEGLVDYVLANDRIGP